MLVAHAPVALLITPWSFPAAMAARRLRGEPAETPGRRSRSALSNPGIRRASSTWSTRTLSFALLRLACPSGRRSAGGCSACAPQVVSARR